MTWQEIQALITTPLFWVASTIVALAVSIVANLLTPRVSAIITRTHQWRRLGTRKKQIERRSKVIALQADIQRRISKRLDGIFFMLLAVSLLLLIVVSQQIDTKIDSSAFQLSGAILSLLALIGALITLKLGTDNMQLASAAEHRETAVGNFARMDQPPSVEDVKKFEDDWDRKQFGVTSQDSML